MFPVHIQKMINSSQTRKEKLELKNRYKTKRGRSQHNKGLGRLMVKIVAKPF